MRLSLFCRATAVLCAISFPSILSGQVLEPNAGFRIPFPDLPPNILATQVNPSIQTGVSVQLPSNYSEDETFPLFVYLDGGHGGNGENTEFPRQLIGKENYVVASFPLFRKPGYDQDSYLNGIIVGFDDYDAISSAYKTILAELNRQIPNLDPTRSIIGGHSNGAKTVSLLLSAMDETALKSFRGFFMVDGGFNWSSYCRTTELADHHLLFLAGGGDENSGAGRKYIVARMKSMTEFAKARSMPNWRFVTVDNVEHEFASKYHKVIRDWAAQIGND